MSSRRSTDHPSSLSGESSLRRDLCNSVQECVSGGRGVMCECVCVCVCVCVWGGGGGNILISIPYMVVFPVVKPRLLLALHVYVSTLSSTGVTVKSK